MDKLPSKETKICASCGNLLDDDARTVGDELCPRCLMAQAMQPTTANCPNAAITPTLQDVSEAFPDLDILDLIGRGGMGTVFKARQKSLDRIVALKLLPQSLAVDAMFSDRFESEAKALATLNHPGIVTIHEFGNQGGFFFLLMEFVDGVNLRELLRTRQVSPEEALAIVPPLCEALQFAHDKGIVHRDIKPENLLLGKDGRIKVADFGIAKILGNTSSQPEKTAGTPGYMAPEQKSSPHTADNRADIYSLGVVIYEMLTGERPDGDLQPPSTKAHIDVRLDEVVLRALNTQPELRWQNAGDLKTQLETIVSTPEPSVTALQRKTTWFGYLSLVALFASVSALIIGNSPTAMIAAVILFVIGILLGGLWIKGLKHSTAPRASRACAYTLASLLIPLALLAVMYFLFSQKNAEAVKEAEQSHSLHEDLAEATASMHQARRSNAAPETLQQLANATEQAEDAISAHESDLKNLRANSVSKIRVFSLIVSLLPGLVMILLAIAGITQGWQHLAWLRRNKGQKTGRTRALFAALFWPLIVASSLAFLVVMLPLNHGNWVSLGISLGIVSAITVSIWCIRFTIRWTNNESA